MRVPFWNQHFLSRGVDQNVSTFAILVDTDLLAGFRSEDCLSRVTSPSGFRDANGYAQISGEQRKNLECEVNVVGLDG
jgi:hypothetical protein